jgi:hypothetical protein
VFSLEMKGEVAGRLVFDRGQGGHGWPLVLGEPGKGDCEGRRAGEEMAERGELPMGRWPEPK